MNVCESANVIMTCRVKHCEWLSKNRNADHLHLNFNCRFALVNLRKCVWHSCKQDSDK